MGISTYAGNAVLDLLLRGVALAAPARVYVSLHTGNPGNDGANEVTVGQWPAYVRKDAADGAAVGTGFSAAAAKDAKNAKELLWDDAMDGGATITVSHFGIWDADNAGNFLFGGALTDARDIAPDDEVVIHIAQLDVSVL